PMSGILGLWVRTPLYIRIVIGLVLGVVLGELISSTAAARLNIPAQLLLRLLGAIAPPLILVAVVRALVTAEVKGRQAGYLMFLLALNTVVAILIGLFVANVLQPGRHGNLPPGDLPKASGDPVAQLMANIPESLFAPLVDNNVIGVIIIAVAFGLAAR